MEENIIESENIEKKKSKKIVIFVILGVVLAAAAVVFLLVVLPAIEKSKYRGEVDGIITMGKYEQDGDESNGAEDIQWIILQKEGDKELVVSRYALDVRPYHTADSEVSWESSSIRSWLNEELVDEIFDESELKFIADSKIESKQILDKSSYMGVGSFHYETDNDGKDSNVEYTTDKLFLLSMEEANLLFLNEASRMCEASMAIKQKLGSTTSGYEWWLRDSKYQEYNWNYSGFFVSGDKTLKNNYAMCVGADGKEVGLDSSWRIPNNTNILVRPAMWIDLS